MTSEYRRELAKLFNEVPDLYDRVRPGYPQELFADLTAITSLNSESSVLEVGCGTGQATRSLAPLGCLIIAVEPGVELTAVAMKRLEAFSNVEIETSTFENWDDRGRHFDILMAANSWHWIDPAIGWRRAHGSLKHQGWIALLEHVVIGRPNEQEVYAETADLHERFVPGDPDWGHPPLEDQVRETQQGWGLSNDPGDLFAQPIVHWYQSSQQFDGNGFADLLRSSSQYRKLDHELRERLLDAIAHRIRTRMADRATRHYLTVLRVARRID